MSGEVATDSTVPMELESEDQEAEEGERGAKERQSLPGESFYATGKMLFLQQKQLVITYVFCCDVIGLLELGRHSPEGS